MARAAAAVAHPVALADAAVQLSFGGAGAQGWRSRGALAGSMHPVQSAETP